MSNIQQFKTAHQRFYKALRYITDHEAELKVDPKRWVKVKQNFELKFEKPLDEAWQALTPDEKKSLSSIYLHRKAEAEPVVKKVLETFGGRIVRVKEKEDA